MRRSRKNNCSKRAITLVELIVAMTLTAIFAAACVMLIYPVSKVYMHVNDLSRAQLLADSVVDVLRSECSRTYIVDANSVVIRGEDPIYGNMLVVQKTSNYIETIASNYAITSAEWTAVINQNISELSESGSTDLPQIGPEGFTSRAVYRMFTGSSVNPTIVAGTPAYDAEIGYVHFGYLVSSTTAIDDDTPRYDFTNPFPYSTYSFSNRNNYRIRLEFHWDSAVETTTPAYVLCDVSVLRQTGTDSNHQPICDPTPIYTRSDVVLCFASPVV